MGSTIIKKILSVATILTLVIPAKAQFDWDDPNINWDWDKNRHSVTLTVGYNSLIGIATLPHLTYFKDAIPNINTENISANTPYGNYGVQYHYNFLQWLRFGLKMNFDVNKLTIDSDTKTIFYANLLPSLQFTYYNTNKWRVYSGIDLGVSFLASKEFPVVTHPAFNITPVGFSYGRGIIFFMETNIGFDAVIKGGIGLRL